MIAAMMLALLAGGTPSAAAAPVQDPPIQIWLNNDRHFSQGDRAKVQVQADEDGYVVVLHADPDGRVRVLFPLDPGDDNFVRGGHRYEVRGRGNGESFSVDASSGAGMVYAAVSRDPLRFDDFVQGDHWDYRALNATELSQDPEPDLTDLVQRMATSHFDYDILSYDVGYNDVAYYTSSPYVARAAYDPFCDFTWSCDPYYFSGRSGLSVNLIFGRPYRSFYDPFYYDPFYYGGYYGGYHRGYGYGGYPYPYFRNPRSTYIGQIYTPYQFKSINRTWGNGNRFGQATHTVYGPRLNQPRMGTPSKPGLNGRPGVTPAPSGRQGWPGRSTEGRRSESPGSTKSSRPEGQRVASPRDAAGSRGSSGRSPDAQRVERPTPAAPKRVEGQRVQIPRESAGSRGWSGRQPQSRPEVSRPSQPAPQRESRPQVERAAPREAPRQAPREQQPRAAPQEKQGGGGGWAGRRSR